MSDEQHLAMPQLYGGPAYSRPPRPVQEIIRPFDPDELPLEADRIDGDASLATDLTGTAWAPTSAPPAKPKARRGRAAKAAKVDKGAPAAAAGPDESRPSGLQGRPFSLRSLGRIFGGDRK